MAKKVKDKWLGARVDENLDGLVDTYIDAAELTMGELVRLAVVEYMNNHPIAPTKPRKATKK